MNKRTAEYIAFVTCTNASGKTWERIIPIYDAMRYDVAYNRVVAIINERNKDNTTKWTLTNIYVLCKG